MALGEAGWALIFRHLDACTLWQICPEVCKSWRSMIEDPSFRAWVSKEQAESSKQYRVLLNTSDNMNLFLWNPSRPRMNIVSEIDDWDMADALVGSSKGLVCFQKRNPYNRETNLLIGNPLTNEWGTVNLDFNMWHEKANIDIYEETTTEGSTWPLYQMEVADAQTGHYKIAVSYQKNLYPDPRIVACKFWHVYDSKAQAWSITHKPDQNHRTVDRGGVCMYSLMLNRWITLAIPGLRSNFAGTCIWRYKGEVYVAGMVDVTLDTSSPSSDSEAKQSRFEVWRVGDQDRVHKVTAMDELLPEIERDARLDPKYSRVGAGSAEGNLVLQMYSPVLLEKGSVQPYSEPVCYDLASSSAKFGEHRKQNCIGIEYGFVYCPSLVKPFSNKAGQAIE